MDGRCSGDGLNLNSNGGIDDGGGASCVWISAERYMTLPKADDD